MPEDDYQVQRTISAYALLTGRRLPEGGDWAPVLNLWLPDGVWAIPHLGLEFVGHAAIEQALAGLSADFDHVLQHNAPAVIRMAGDMAYARSGIREVGRFRGRDEAFEYHGIYDDTLVRTLGGWKFKWRVFESLGTLTWPLSARP